MNDFLAKAHKQIMDSISQYAPCAGLLTVDFAVDDSIGAMVYGLKPGKGNQKQIVILTVSSQIEMSDSLAAMVFPLIDSTSNGNNRLIVIHSDGKSKQENDIYAFLSEKADMFHPGYLRLWVSPGNLQTTINGERYAGLRNILRKYFSGEIAFTGPVAGKQQVNIEIYKDICRRCKKEIAVVSGIVFPKIQMPQWNNPFWQYYNALLPLHLLPGTYCRQIKKEVEGLRKEDTGVTPLIYYQDVEAGENNWTVMCPHCKGVIHPYEPEDKRMDYLLDFNGRMNGNLRYHPVLTDADQELIDLLDAGVEFNPHACYAGWGEVESKIVQP